MAPALGEGRDEGLELRLPDQSDGLARRDPLSHALLALGPGLESRAPNSPGNPWFTGV